MYNQIAPGSKLSSFVDAFWAVNTQTTDRLIIPDGSVDIIFHFSNKCSVFINGAMTKPETIMPNRGDRFLGVRLKIGMANRILNMPINSLTDRIATFDDLKIKKLCFDSIIDDDGLSLEEFSKRVEVQLLKQYQSIRNKYDLSLIDILSSITEGTIYDIAKTLGISRRHFSRIFNEIFGYSPRLYSKLKRFNKLKLLVKNDHLLSNLSISGEAGYYDQSHMHHDIKSLTGLTFKIFKKNIC